MGIFTWTDARLKSPERRDYEYRRRDLVEYGSYGKIVCPDNTVYETECYDGYGSFGGKDAYELVVEWNREDLKSIFTTIVDCKKFGRKLAGIAARFAEGASDEEIREDVRKQVAEGTLSEFLVSDWKRNIGIAISCDDKDNASLRYPIKIVNTRESVRYENLYPSRSTQ